jgi:hypothetical protein
MQKEEIRSKENYTKAIKKKMEDLHKQKEKYQKN